MDGKIDEIREAIEGLLRAANRNVGGMVPGVIASWCHEALSTLSAHDEEIRRECAYKAKQAVLSAPYDNPTRAYAAALAEAAIFSAEPAQDERPRWSPTDIGMLAAMMTGDIDKDWATLTAYLSDEPAQDDGKPILPMFPLQNGNEGDWIIDFDFLMAIQKEYRDADDYGKPSLEEIEETLLVLMRSAEVKRRLEEAKE